MHSQQGIKYVGVAIVYFCHDNKGNFVMAKRSKKARDENGKWDIGGGGLDFDLSVEKTLKKEIKEEYCTKVLSYEFLGYRDVFRTHKGKRTHWVTLDFKVLIDRTKVKIGEPDLFTELKWFKLEELPNDVHSQLPAFLDKYHNKLK
jgi:8-oxo-dGTP pyrophosphatase MutT (NUDIX family)